MALLLFIVAMLQAQAAPQAPPRDTPKPSSARTSSISGRVTDRDTGQPLRRIAIRLNLGGREPMSFETATNAEGRYELTDLPAGEYSASASPDEFSAGYGYKTFGAVEGSLGFNPAPPLVLKEHRASHVREPFPAAHPSGAIESVTLSDGEVRSHINIELRRSLAISGRVVDEFGDPVVGITVRTSSAYGRPYASQRSRTTDDRGMFRVFGLGSGRYVVCAQIYQRHPSRNTTIAIAEFVTTCYPSALDEAEGHMVTLSGSDVEGIEIRMRRRRLLSISGIALDSTGAVAQSAAITFHRFERSGGSSGTTNSSDGQFRFTGLVPGDYAVEASLAGVTAAGAPSAAVKERGYARVTLAEDHVTDLVVSLRPPANLQGRLVFEDGPPPSGSVGALTVTAWPETGRFHTPIRPARVENDLSFTLNGLSGRLRLSVPSLPRGWVLKSIRYKGIDITEAATEFVTDPAQQVEIVLTTRPAIVSGSVTDDTGGPAAGACVLLLSTVPTQPVSAVYGRTAMITRDGRFTLPGVAAGDYLLVTIPCPQYEALRQRGAQTETLVKHAERVTLVENDRLTMSLRLVTLPEK
jgi:hypothetical protein